MSEMFIYVLCDPDTNAVRYVGRTKNPKQRYSGHMSGRYEYQPKVDWIDALRSQGKKPHMDIIAVDDGDGKEIEAHYINLFAEQGCNLLQSVDHIPGEWTCKLRTQEARRRAKTHCKNGHAFTPENTHVHPRNGYICRTCTREQQRARKMRLEAIA